MSPGYITLDIHRVGGRLVFRIFVVGRCLEGCVSAESSMEGDPAVLRYILPQTSAQHGVQCKRLLLARSPCIVGTMRIKNEQ